MHCIALHCVVLCCVSWIIRSSKGCSARWTQETKPALSVAGSVIIMSNITTIVINSNS